MVNDKYFRRAYLVRVKDGDTLVANVDLGFSVWTRQTFRLYGIQAPESNTTAGKRAAAFLEMVLPTGIELVVEIIRTPGGKESRTFGRYVAIPWFAGTNICELLVDKGHAKRWSKFKRFKKGKK